MRYLIFALLLVLCLPQLGQASSWNDNGDGTWSVTLTVTVPAAVKNKAEQCRAWDNYRWRYASTQLDASAWLQATLEGLNGRAGSTLYNNLKIMWNRFVQEWVPKNSSTPEADGLAVTVPSPPVAP